MKKFISALIAMAMTLAVVPCAAVLADNHENLYALYTFNETMSGVSRTTAADRSGKGHTAKARFSTRAA